VTPAITVRDATPDDTAAVRCLCRGLDPDDYVIGAWDAWRSIPGDVNLVAEMDGRIVGCVRAGFVSDVEVFSQAVRVDPQAQRHGVATALVRTQETILRARGVVTIRGTTGLANARARSFFAAVGYREAAVVIRRRISTWPARTGEPALLPTSETLELMRRASFLASRPALAVYKRVYFAPSPSWLQDAARQGRMVCTTDHAWAVLDPASPAEGIWIGALGGAPGPLRDLLLGLSAPQVAGPALTVDAPADPDIQEMLDRLGFEESGALDQYVVLEGGGGSAGENRGQ
jgi:GNAT superfamily N-acetyltransferase